MKKILVADPIAQDGIDILKSEADVDVRTGMSPDELKRTVGDYHALVVRSETRVTAEIFDAGKQLEAVGRAGVGVDNIDLEAATARGVIVVNAPLGNTISAAEHTIGLMLALARHIAPADASLRGGEWKRSQFAGVEVRGKTLGVVGLGNVGSEVARRGKGLDMNVVAYDPFVSPERAQMLGVELAGSLDDVIRRADFLTLHSKLTAETHNQLGAARARHDEAHRAHHQRRPRRAHRSRCARESPRQRTRSPAPPSTSSRKSRRARQKRTRRRSGRIRSSSIRRSSSRRTSARRPPKRRSASPSTSRARSSRSSAASPRSTPSTRPWSPPRR